MAFGRHGQPAGTGSVRPRSEGALVLMTTDTVGGVWHYAVGLATSLIEDHGLRVALATMGTPLSGAQRRQVASLAGLTLHESSYRLEWMAEPWADVACAGDWLLALERRLAPDLVHLNQFAFGALPFAAPTLLVAHSCVVSWWQAVHGTEPPAHWARYREVVRAGLAGAGLVGAPTRDMLRSLARNHGYQGQALVLPNGRDSRLYRPQPKSAVVIGAGRLWDEAKNLRALEAIGPFMPWPIEVAGSARGPDGRLRPSHGVRLLGELSAGELAGRLAQASICAHPARYEPCGLVPLEAALAGCALVLGDLPSLRETWKDAAIYIPPDDHAALRSALLRLIHQSDLLREMSQRARKVALCHSSGAMAQAYVAAYARALSLPPAAFPPISPVSPHLE
jgi:glycogen(starch) synthase